MEPLTLPTQQPLLQTPRLTLRGIRPGDIDDLVRLAGDRDIAATTLRLPHPYTRADAEVWIARQAAGLARAEAVNFAIAERASEVLVGVVGLRLTADHCRAELGYWIGKPHWNHGYATEAARGVLAYAFEHIGLNRVEAVYFPRNGASAAVLRKIGMRREGVMRQHYLKWGTFEDAEVCAILRSEYDAAPAAIRP